MWKCELTSAATIENAAASLYYTFPVSHILSNEFCLSFILITLSLDELSEELLDKKTPLLELAVQKGSNKARLSIYIFSLKNTLFCEVTL